MPGFDPDAYLAQPASGFDPDVYLKPDEQAPDQQVGPLRMISNAAGRGLWAIPGVFGLDRDTVAAAENAVTDPNKRGGELKDRFDYYRGLHRAESNRVDQQYPITSGLVRSVASLPGEAAAWMAAPEVKGAEALSALQKFLTYGSRLGFLGGASEYGSTANKDPVERAKGAAVAATVSGLTGGGMGAALPFPQALAPGLAPNADPNAIARTEAKAAADAAARASAEGGGAGASTLTEIQLRPPPKQPLIPKLMRDPKPIPEAQYLMDRGVQLTTGLMDPRSARAQTEIASQSLPVVGAKITQQRDAALHQAMDLVFNDARPPGSAALKLGGDINDKLETLARAWDDAYGSFKERAGEIYPAIHDGKGGVRLIGTQNQPGALDLAVGDRNILATANARRSVYDFVKGQFTKLAESKGALGRESVADLLDIRSTIRKEMRNQIRRQAKDGESELLGAAEQKITEAIESQLPEGLSSRLRALDGNYRAFKVAEEAVSRAGDSPKGVTPAQLSAAVRAIESSKAGYAQGNGALRDLSKSVRTVFDESISPPTGQRLLTLAPDWVNRLNAGTVYIRNSSAINAQGGKAAAGAASQAGSRLAQESEQGMRRAALLAAARSGRPGWAKSNDPLLRALMARWDVGALPAVADDEGTSR